MSRPTIPVKPPPLLSVVEVAELMGTTPGSIYEGRRKGTGVGALGFRVGRLLRFDSEDIASFIADQKLSDPRHQAVER